MGYTVGSLFAGIGGFDLGFARAGYDILWQVEIDRYCQKVLAKHFPEAKRYGDIRDCGRANLVPVDVICGGFPCQDISNAGCRVGIDGDRSGLWREMYRIIGELRPRFVLVENVAALLGRGIGRVLGDLAEIGYDAEWKIISAANVGAPHLRERVWILAHTRSLRREGSREPIDTGDSPTSGEGQTGDAFDVRLGDFWAIEPNVGRVAHGVPRRVDRLRGLGNAVVPQIPELFAHHIRRVLEAEL